MANVAVHTAATGLSALATELDVIANNLANLNTTGFKGYRTNFQDLLYQERAQPGVENELGDRRPTGVYVGLGVKVSGTQLDFEQGPAVPTERQLDVMIDGNGFFQVVIESDIGEGLGYSRAGNFIINQDNELVLGTDQGRRLEPSIVLPDNFTNIAITTDGRVYVDQPGSIDPVEVGQFELATFINPAGLRNLGENLYIPSAASGDPETGVPTESGRGALRQGFLEGSNVDPATELVKLIQTQRAYEFNSQVIQAADEALQTISQLRRF